MEIRYNLNRDEVKEIIEKAVIGKYFPEGLPEGMEATVSVESYGVSTVEVYEKEVATIQIDAKGER